MEIRSGVAATGLSTITDGVTTVFNATELTFTGATVTNLGGGNVGVSITGGSATPGGSTTQLQYNNAGVFGGITGATTDGTNITFAGGSLMLGGASTGTVALMYASTATSGGSYTFPATASALIVATTNGANTFSGINSFTSATSFTVTNAPTVSIGNSTSNPTYSFGFGATSSGNTKTMNIGTNGVSGSTTNITIGSTFGTTVTVNSLGNGLVKSTSGVLGLATSGTDYLASASTDATLTGNGLSATPLGINLANGNTWTGLQTYNDNALKIMNVTDPTKIALFDLSNLTSGTTETYRFPATGATGIVTIATTNNTSQTFAGATTFSATTGVFGSSTGNTTYGYGNGVTSNGNTKTLGIGTQGASGSTTNIVIGSATAGALGSTTINSPTVIISNSNLTLATAGNGLFIKEGSNATMGTGTLAAGTLVVSNTKVTTSSRIFLTSEGGTVTNLGTLYISARTAGTSFTVSSSNVLDTQTFVYLLVEPA